MEAVTFDMSLEGLLGWRQGGRWADGIVWKSDELSSVFGDTGYFTVTRA